MKAAAATYSLTKQDELSRQLKYQQHQIDTLVGQVKNLVSVVRAMQASPSVARPGNPSFGKRVFLDEDPKHIERGLMGKESLSESSYVSQLKRRLRFVHNKAKQMAKKQQAKHRELYDQRGRGAELEVGDLVLVEQTACKGRHKIQDRWESEEYQVVGQPTPGIPV